VPALHDLRCENGHETHDVLVSAGCFPACAICNQPMRPDYSRWTRGLATDSWGGPRYFTSLDETFASRSELKAHLKRMGWMEAGDKVGGARNEEQLRHKSRPLVFDRAGIGAGTLRRSARSEVGR
jgi:hypothetical protein